MVFSSDGNELFALVRVKKGDVNFEQILVLPTADFLPLSLNRVKPQVISASLVREWKPACQTADFTVSENRKLIVLWTSPASELAQVRILKGMERGWTNLGCAEIRMCQEGEAKTILAKVNGIRLYLPL